MTQVADDIRRARVFAARYKRPRITEHAIMSAFLGELVRRHRSPRFIITKAVLEQRNIFFAAEPAIEERKVDLFLEKITEDLRIIHSNELIVEIRIDSFVN